MSGYRTASEDPVLTPQETYQLLYEESLDAILLLRDDGTIVDANHRALKMYGYALNEMVGRHLDELGDPDELKRVWRLRDDNLSDRPLLLERRMLKKDGSSFYVEVSVGSVAHDTIPCICRDITDRKRIENALRESEKKYRSVFDHSPIGLVHLDRHGIITACNDKFLDLFAVPRGAVIGFNVFDHVTPLDIRNAVRDALEGKIGLYEGDYPSMLSGKTMYLRSVIAPVLDENGSITGCTGIVEDASEMKRAQQLLLQAEGFKAIADLTGGVAHNFNNLLQVVMGNAELAAMNLERGDLAEVQGSLEAILTSSTFAAETVQRLTEFSALRMQPDRSEIEAFDFSAIVLDAIHMTRPFWKSGPEKRGVRVELRSDLRPGCFVQGYKHELFDVAINLIKNAAEALPAGGRIDVRCSLDGNEVVLSVRDDGIGIPQQDLTRVFTPFFTTKKDIGSGLSLATSRAVVDQHGGRIFVKSPDGLGAEFSVRLPLAEDLPARGASPERARMPARPLVILAIDDMEPVLTLLKKWLSKYGHEVITTLNGRDGLRILEEYPIDLVICDLAMPEMNGWEVGRRIKESRGRHHKHKTPFILLTGWSDPADDQKHIEDSGVDAVVQKPIDIRALMSVMAAVLSPEPPPAEAP